MSCKLAKTDGQTWSNTGTPITKVLLNNTVYSYPGTFSDIANSKAVAPRTSNYYIHWSGAPNSNNAAATMWQNFMYINGSAFGAANTDLLANKISTVSYITVTTVLAGQAIEGYCRYFAGSYVTSILYPTDSCTLLVAEIPAW
jgi:hypothetical protein